MGIVIARTHTRRGPNGVQARQLFRARLERIRAWVGRRLGSTRHEERVMRIAAGIFHLTSNTHGLDHGHLRILKFAALLHDVGRLHGADEHHARGAQLVLEGRTLELDASERLAVAYLTWYHRGAVVSPRKDRRFAGLRQPRAMRVLLAILRAADALDSRKFETPAVALERKGDRLRIRCYVDDVTRAEDVLGRKKKYRMLEEELGVRLEVQWREAE